VIPVLVWVPAGAVDVAATPLEDTAPL
jgi:hypothetical protein